jgi:CubicO group peptidase (beta-lactamase class C family)
MSRSLRLLALCLLFARVGHAQEHAQEIDRILEQQVRELHIPGAALAIVKDDRVVYVKTIGLRDVEHNLAVSEETIFPIGSCTKAFTSMAIALSADRGLLSLDDHPQKYLPYLKLADPDANARITIKDMLSHRTGLPAKNDLAAEPGVLTREEYIRTATSVKPAAPFGTRFLYSNAMFAAAGEIVAKVNHDTWEHVIARDIFKPLAMPSSVADLRDAKRATGYVWDGKAWQAVAPSLSMQALAPAGSIASSVRDMTQWVRMLANGGRGFVSEKMFRELTTPLMKVNDTTGYALGWATYNWNGLRVVEHNGGSTGISALVAFIPERHVGFVFLANTSPNAMTKIGNAGQMLWPLILPDDAPNANRIVARMIEAAGAFRSHTSYEMHALRTYEEHGVVSEMTIHAKAPASRNVLEVLKALDREIGRAREYFDGAHGGQETTFGQDSINDDAANARARRNDAFHRLLELHPIAANDAGDTWVLDLDGGTHLYVSKQTGLITKRESEGEVATFDDYRNVDGEMVPFHTTIHDGLGTSTIVVQWVKFNVPIGDGTFKPSSP